MDSIDYQQSLKTIKDQNGDHLPLSGLYDHFETEQKDQENVARENGGELKHHYIPFYILEKLELVSAVIPYEHPVQNLRTKAELGEALRKGWLRKIPSWDLIPVDIVRDLVIELAFRQRKQIAQLVAIAITGSH